MNRTDVPLIGVAQPASNGSYFLGEGPVWDPIGARLLWVDIMAGVVHTGTLNDDDTVSVSESIQSPDTAGAVAVAEDGSLLIAGMYRLHYVDTDGIVRSSRKLLDEPDRRFNDGKPDPAGRFLVGTKGPGNELLMRVDADETVTVFDGDLTLSNGIAWNDDGTLLYSVDTLNRRIHVRDYDPITGEHGPRRVFVDIDDGYPDGMTSDAEDHLWVAIWGKGEVLRISPDGAVVGRVEVAAPQTSCVVFAGADLRTLVITTATENLDEVDLAAYPDSGRLFTLRTRVAGNPPHLWNGDRPYIEETPE